MKYSVFFPLRLWIFLSSCSIILANSGILTIAGLPGVSSAMAQTYVPIDDDRGIYCADFEDGEYGLVSYNPKSGVVATVSADDEIAALKKRILGAKKRARALRRLRKQQLPSRNLDTYRKIYKYTFGKKFKGGREQAIKSLSRTIKKLSREAKQLQKLIDKIKACLGGTLPDPQSGIIRTVSFQTTNPDTGDSLWIYGIAAVYKWVNKNKNFGYVCLGSENRVGSPTSPSQALMPVLPETLFTEPQVNPCAHLYPGVFSKYPSGCSGVDVDGDPTTVVVWLDVNFGSTPFGMLGEENYQQRIDLLGLVSSRPFSKKSGCS